MKYSPKNIILKTLKIIGITVGSILLLLFLIPLLFPGTIAEQVKKAANEKLDGELNFKETHLSFYKHFPSLTVSLDEFSLKGSAPYRNDTLVAAKEVAFGINLKRLIFDNQVSIDEIYLSNGLANIMVDEHGHANYNVYISNAPKTTSDTASASIRLDRIEIKNVHLKYNDLSAKLAIDAKDFNYIGKGDLDKAIFDLTTKARIGSLDFAFDGETYLKNKVVNADLLTRINTNSLSFVFRQNNLKINKLPVKFIGKLDFLKDGYDIDIHVETKDSKLNDLFTAMPPAYVTWLEKTKVQGQTDVLFTFKGIYNASQNKKPDLGLSVNIRDGFIAYKDTPFPTSNIYLKLNTRLPSLNPDLLEINMDSIHFNVGKDFMKGKLYSKGMKQITLDTDMKAKLDLEKLNRALGLEKIELKGLLTTSIKAKGDYDASQKKFPVTDGFLAVQSGRLKTPYYPNPIDSIRINARINNTSGNYKDLKVKVTPASFHFEGNPVFVAADLSNFDDLAYAVKAKGEIDVAKVYKVFKQEGLDVKGYIKADLFLQGRQSYATTGQYGKMNNKGTLVLRDIAAKSQFFPKPFLIKEGLFKFDRDKMFFNGFKAGYGQSDFNLNGQLQNVINYVLSDKSVLSGNFTVNSDFLNINEFMAYNPDGVKSNNSKVNAKKTKPKEPTGVVVVPTNLNVSVVANAKRIDYDGLVLNDMSGKAMVKKGKIMLRNAGVGIIGSRMTLDGVYDDVSADKANFNLRYRAKDFDVNRAYREVKLFRDLMTSAENAEGIIGVDYHLRGVLDQNMQPIMPSLKGDGVVKVKKVKIKGLKLFSAISKKTGSDGIDNPDLSEVEINSMIKNNVITIDETLIKVALFRLKFKGQTNFAGQMNLRMRLGLPPFGLIGIPVVITGNKDNPKIKVFSKTGEEVQETEYKGTPAPQSPPETEPKQPATTPDKPKE
ncbi:AsmA family protein [Flavobacterium cerinum]|uniref:AsmA family protein n=1 Tax=Flavobacterium cerinum TaxID=2502784 RepID=A0ABY5IVS5_9FLAO|nr:AsmA family protein [Flavobacterium cerinum]UUC45858.1 AsmA family protein [Flavobacterium cerinum]